MFLRALNYYWVTVNFSLHVCEYLLYVFRCLYVGCIYVVVFVFKSILSDISNTTFALFLFSPAQYTLFCPLTFSLYPFSYLLIGALSPLTFNIAIGTYSHVSTLLIVCGLLLQFFFCSFLLLLSSCDLMTLFLFGFLSLPCVYICYRFLVCGYHEGCECVCVCACVS